MGHYMIAEFNSAMKRWAALVASGAMLIAPLAVSNAVEPATQSASTGPSLRATSGPRQEQDAAVALTSDIQDAHAQRLDDEVIQKLYKPVLIKFDGCGISEWTGELGKAAGVNIIVYGKVLEAAGVRKDASVGLIMHEAAPAGQVLARALHDLSGGNGKISYAVDHGAVVISTVEDLANLTVTRIYEDADLAGRPDADNLQSLVSAVVDPTSWRENGGQVGVVRQFQDKLLVIQTVQNHAEIERLLAFLRAKSGKAAASGAGGAAAEARAKGGDLDVIIATLSAELGPNHPRVKVFEKERANQFARVQAELKDRTKAHIEQMLIAVRIYEHEHQRMPVRGFEDGGLTDLLNGNPHFNPRLPDLRYGFRWLAPNVARLSDVQDPAHTPMITEVGPQPDGTELVGYVDGHVAELSAAEVKAMDLSAARVEKK